MLTILCIVDNGSQDRSVEISSNYTDNIHFNLDNDLDIIKNDFHKITDAEWILSIDADEEFFCKCNLHNYLSMIPETTLAIRVPTINSGLEH